MWRNLMAMLSCCFLVTGCAAGIDDPGSGGGGSSSLPELEVQQVSGTRATVTWTEPANSNVASYAVRYAAASANLVVSPAVSWDDMTPVVDPPDPVGALNAVSFVIDGLNPESEYTVAVRYTTTAGDVSEAATGAVDTSLRSVTYVADEPMRLMGWRTAAGDVNDDGYVDAIFGSALDAGDVPATVPLFLGGPTPSGEPSVIFTPDAASRFSSGVAIGDVNCDGIDDLLIGDGNYDEPGTTLQGSVSIYFGRADWDASYTQTADADVLLLNASDRNERDDQFGGTIAVGSDGAGCSYLLISGYNYTAGVDQIGAIYVLEGPITASRRVTVGERACVGDVEDGRAGLYLNTIGHLTADAVDWLAFVSSYSNEAGVASEVTLDNGTDSLPPQTVDIMMQAPGAPVIMANVGDVDGNGWDDFVIATSGVVGGLVHLYLNSGDFTEVGELLVIEDTERPYFAVGVAGGDINNDGSIDLVIAGTEASYIYLGPYSGTTWLDGGPDLTVPAPALSLLLGDVNGDSYIDFIGGDIFLDDAFSGGMRISY